MRESPPSRTVVPSRRPPRSLAALSSSRRHARPARLLGLAFTSALALSILACGGPRAPDEPTVDPVTGNPSAPVKRRYNPFSPPQTQTPPAFPPSDEPVPPPAGDPNGEIPATEEPPPEIPEVALPSCTGSVLSAFRLEEILPPAKGSNGYKVPSVARRDAVRDSIEALLAGDTQRALNHATSAEYLLCRGSGAESELVLWKPAPREGQAVIALRLGEARPVIFEAPHIVFDSGTLKESVVLFERLRARALISSGTHRCANTQASPCSGTTAVCGSSAAYRISDMAHTDESIFHAAHVALSEHYGDDWVIGVHGMGRSGASVSNGTNGATDPGSPSARIAVALSEAFSGVTTCNAFGGVPYADHLCGTTCTQGRHLNGSTQACGTAATKSTQRFIHLEQGSTLRDQPVKVADALDTVLPR